MQRIRARGQERVKSCDWTTWQPSSTLSVLPPDALTREQETIRGQYYRVGLNASDLQLAHSLPTYNLQTRLVDRNSNTTTFSYDGSGNLSTIKDFNNQVVTFGYSSGKVQTITDPANRVMTLGYDGSSRLNAITDPTPASGVAAPVTSFSYDSSDRITKLTDPRSNSFTFVYDSYGSRVAEIIRPDPTTPVHEYLFPQQIQGLPVGATTTAVLAVGVAAAYVDGETNNWVTRFDWLGNGRASQEYDPLAAQSVRYRDSKGLAWLSADPLARRTRLFFDSKGNPTTLVFADDNKELYEYSTTFSLVTKRTEAGGQVTTYTRNTTTGNLTQITQPDPGSGSPTIGYDYNTGGWVNKVTDPLGNTTSFTYDSTIKNRLTKITFPDDACPSACPSVVYDYDTNGNVSKRTDERGYTTTATFDNLDRRTEVRLPVESGTVPIWTYGYDAASNLTTVKDPASKTTTTAYDSLNRRLSVTDPLSHVWTYTHDNSHMLIRVTDALSHSVTYSYDGADRLVGITDALTHTWVYNYDAAGQRIASTDPLGNTTSFAYHTRGWLKTVTDPLLGEARYGYNANGDRITITEYDPGTPTQTFTTAYDWDNLQRLTTYTDARGNLITYSYDKAGNRLSVTGAARGNPFFDVDAGDACSCSCECDPCAVDIDHGTFSFTYDKRKRLRTRKDNDGKVTTYTKDDAGNCTKIELPAVPAPVLSVSPTTEYGYDPQNRVKWVQDPNDYYVTFTYDLVGRLETVKDPNNNLTSYGYDDAGRRTTVKDPNSDLTTYGYDNANRLTSKLDRLDRQVTYGYDNADRRTSERWLDGGSTTRLFTYAYDDANRLTSARDLDSWYTYTYDAADQLKTVNGTGPAGMPGLFLTYTYDGLNNRRKLEDNLGSGGVLSYGYNGNHDLPGEQGVAEEEEEYGGVVAEQQPACGREEDARRQQQQAEEEEHDGGAGGEHGEIILSVSRRRGRVAANRNLLDSSPAGWST